MKKEKQRDRERNRDREKKQYNPANEGAAISVVLTPSTGVNCETRSKAI